MKIVGKGIVFAGRKDTDLSSCAFPQVCVLPGGRWVCSFRAAPSKSGTAVQHVLVTWSDDEGKSWREPVEPFSSQSVDGKPGQFRGAALTSLGGQQVLAAVCWVDHSDPSLPFFNEQTQGLLDTRIFLARSNDGGTTWSEPKLMDTWPFCVPTPITGPMLLLPSGDLACQFELNKHYDDTSPWHHSSVMMFSTDGGNSWPEYAIPSNDPENHVFYWDQRPGLLSDGRILDLFWTYDNRAATYRNIHARESTDHGRSWSEMWDTGVPGQPSSPVSLPDGTVAMAHVDRTGAPLIKMLASSDGGRTWSDRSEIVLYGADTVCQTWNKHAMRDARAEMGEFSVGLPATALLPDGDVLVVHYAGPETDQTDIRWVRVRAV